MVWWEELSVPSLVSPDEMETSPNIIAMSRLLVKPSPALLATSLPQATVSPLCSLQRVLSALQNCCPDPEEPTF